jgi:hypothetical protein
MHARVVRFTDVDRDRIDQIKARVASEEGPPPGIDSVGMQLYYDSDQNTAVFIGLFASREKLDEADEVMSTMEPSDTPGTRASVDRTELVVDADA